MNSFLEEYILNYEVKDDYIIIKYASGKTGRITYSKSNEEKLVNMMKKQLEDKECDEFLNYVKGVNEITIEMIKGFSLVFGGFAVFIGTFLINPYITLALIPTTAIGIFLRGFIKRQKIYNAIKKRRYYLANEKVINEETSSEELTKEKEESKIIVKEPIIETKRRYNVNNVEKASYKELRELVDSKTNSQENELKLIK